MGKQAESEGGGATACDGEAEGLRKDGAADAEPQQPARARGPEKRGRCPWGAHRALTGAQARARYLAAGRAGRSLTAGRLRVSLAGRGGASRPSVSSPLPSPGRSLKDHIRTFCGPPSTSALLEGRRRGLTGAEVRACGTGVAVTRDVSPRRPPAGLRAGACLCAQVCRGG